MQFVVPEPAIPPPPPVAVIVKLGYEPVTDIPVPEFKVTVWSGAVLVITFPPKLIPVPAV